MLKLPVSGLTSRYLGFFSIDHMNNRYYIQSSSVPRANARTAVRGDQDRDQGSAREKKKANMRAFSGSPPRGGRYLYRARLLTSEHTRRKCGSVRVNERSGVLGDILITPPHSSSNDCWATTNTPAPEASSSAFRDGVMGIFFSFAFDMSSYSSVMRVERDLRACVRLSWISEVPQSRKVRFQGVTPRKRRRTAGKNCGRMRG